MALTNDFVISVGTVNGSGSQSSNNILVKSLFRMGLPVSAKNMFPSNIAGLPTWFSIRVSEKGYMSRRSPNDIVVAMNSATLLKDQESVKKDGVFFYNSDLKVPSFTVRDDVVSIPLPCREMMESVTDSIKLKKLLTNMLYVGVLAHLLKIEKDVLDKVIEDQFADKMSVIPVNKAAVDAGWKYADENLQGIQFPFTVAKIENGNKDKILIDGNTASAMGLLYGGCTFMAWYPITPSSSLAEGFIHYSNKYRKDVEGHNKFSVVQAEDELSAISMVIGAGWTGSRAVTPTSGPGMSLMSEAAGLSYFAEVPSVIWNVQRVGPSTGLPTRTMQGDLLAAYRLSHGDKEHVVLLPSSPEECFEFGQTCFDLAEQLQSLVVVLSDLNLGMNYWIANKFRATGPSYSRGKVVCEDDLNKWNGPYKRYLDIDKDGVCYRTLPGTRHEQAAYFARGTGHDEGAIYSEDPDNYEKLLDRLSLKMQTARKLVPKPIVKLNSEAKVGLIAYGTSHEPIREVRDELAKAGVETSYLRLRALPLQPEVFDFIEKHDRIYVIEQNRDAQLLQILHHENPSSCQKFRSVRHYNGLPLAAQDICPEILKGENCI